jgi:hypothetical protein
MEMMIDGDDDGLDKINKSGSWILREAHEL